MALPAVFDATLTEWDTLPMGRIWCKVCLSYLGTNDRYTVILLRAMYGTFPAIFSRFRCVQLAVAAPLPLVVRVVGHQLFTFSLMGGAGRFLCLCFHCLSLPYFFVVHRLHRKGVPSNKSITPTSSKIVLYLQVYEVLDPLSLSGCCGVRRTKLVPTASSAHVFHYSSTS